MKYFEKIVRYKVIAIILAVLLVQGDLSVYSYQALDPPEYELENTGKSIDNWEMESSEDTDSGKRNVIEKPGTRVKKKKRFPWLIVIGAAVVVGFVLYLVFKKKPSYTLRVSLGVGVTGSPGSGEHTHKKGSKVKYSYSLVSGYKNLVVQLDGNGIASQGTITVKKNHFLSVTADVAYGSIKVSSVPSGARIWMDGTDSGKTTNTVLENIVPGEHTLLLKKSGYEDREVQVNVESDKQTTLSINLLPKIVWIQIPAGEFMMGDNFNEGHYYEAPVHRVYLDEYYIAKYEITFEQYDIFCRETGRSLPYDEGWGRGKRPAIHVSWNEAIAFCQWWSEVTGVDVRLPTEAEWEKAARGTDQRRFPWGNSSPNCGRLNYNHCQNMTMPVGSYPSSVSPYGLHDMAGNAWEWCSDWFSYTYYSSSPANNPTGPATGTHKVRRSGSWYFDVTGVRSAYRGASQPHFHNYAFGFRMVKENN